MRLLLIFSLFLSFSIDVCMAEEIAQSVKSVWAEESNDICAHISTVESDECSFETENSQKSHEHYGSHGACQHCQACHGWLTPSNLSDLLMAIVSIDNSSYQFSYPTLFYKTLRRPPKV